MIGAKLSSRKKMRNMLFICLLLILILLGRLGFIQFIRGEELSSMAYIQQTLDRNINPKRGTIYDATGKNILAVSSMVETVTVNPGNINQKDKEKVAKELSELFDLNYDTVLKKVTKRSSIETIVKKVEKEKTDELRQKLKTVDVAKTAKELEVGEMTLSDIISELSKPGRDPREDMPKPILRQDVLKLEDLKEGMILTGTVRNVIDFGAFVDIGVKYDGLVHISEMSDKYIKNPSDLVSVGDIVKVKVIKIDMERKKVGLSMKV